MLAQPVSFHLCDDGVDDEAVQTTCRGCGSAIDPNTCWCGVAMVDHRPLDGCPCIPFGCDCHRTIDNDITSDELSRSELIDLELVLSSDNLRSHAEVPEPDGFGLPSTDCIVYRAVAPANLRTEPGTEPFIELITVSSTTLSDLQYEALAVARRLQEHGAKFCGFSLARTRGMGRELDVRIVRANPEVLGFWTRDLAEEALVAAERRLPVPAKVPSESRAVRVTELPVARWQRLNAADVGERGAA